MSAALELAQAGFGGAAGWLERPAAELEGWLRAAAKVIKRHNKARR
ncbi:hypothetical protein Deba_1581 [Desulfarculus baarsii DSM 2075]|uniref:Uncharacterized protein n=1 Tax=Desulfarculus baarsii (strain ATCC 33931 / DSM 2075 / LMG 7858 / VKM B-1802 / 2st14) TaxID=644282 RepID=E1QHA6_DESB2|nr:hypothetical protein [Desulfarculus baarsii]ADK84949.1 hypothetical protein Deba_1581 [Desulfarculus baarsii DSM 2075]